MAQLGRISGGVLQDNLLRNNVDLNFKNNSGSVPVLKLDVSTRQIGINTTALTSTLAVPNNIRSINQITDIDANISDINIQQGQINAVIGNLNFSSINEVHASSIATANLKFDYNALSSTTQDSDIRFEPNGSGTTEIFSNLNVFGNIYTPFNLTFDGNITLGNESSDKIILNTDLDSDIIPKNAIPNLSLGTAQKSWRTISSYLLNGQDINAGVVDISGITLNNLQGNMFYVSLLGDDNAIGDHQQAPVRTIKRALELADGSDAGPITILVFPGEYEEQTPLVIPENVSIKGIDIRNCIVKPAIGYEYNDVFKVNDATYIENLTIKDFYYDSINNTGHAFSFAPGAIMNSRSPYIQNVTVITKGTNAGTDPTDPRGFNDGDAGKGALIDGAVLDASSIQKSLLFHSATFITPGVDAITMTNDVRIEWLNSFTYFANRGLYAVQGLDGGAEIRSIGSANVYGNYGAEADGADTLMYLIGHNFAYIGVGNRVDNDSTLTIDANQTVELNSGKIYHTSTDHRGTFRVGDVFFVDFDRGDTSINTETVDLGGLSSIQINTGGAITILNFEKLETGNIRIGQNTIQSLREQLDFISASGETNFNSNVYMSKNLDITGNYTIAGSLIRLGNEPTDSVDFELEFDQDIYPDTDSEFDLGKSYSEWKNIYLSRMSIDNVRIDTNVIQTVDSDSNLEFRSIGTGSILIDDLEVKNNIIRSINNQNLEITLTNNNNFIIDNTGALKLPAGTTLQLPVSQIVPTLDGGDADDVLLTTTDGGDATTVFNPIFDTIIDSDDSVIFRGTAGDIRFNNDYSIFEGYSTARTNIGGGVFSDDRNTRVLAGRTDNILYFFANNVLTSTINANGVNSIALEIGDIYLDDNTISTNDSNADLELRANGTGSLEVSNVFFKDNIILNTSPTENLVLTSVNSRHVVKVEGTAGVVLPYGNNTTDRPLTPLVGDTRWNTIDEYLEVWNGSEWQRATGTGPIVTSEIFQEFADIYSLILG